MNTDMSQLTPAENAFMNFIIICKNVCQVWEARDVGFLGDEWTALSDRGLLHIEVSEDGTWLSLLPGVAELWQLYRAVKQLQDQMQELHEAKTFQWEMVVTKNDVSLSYRKNKRKDIRRQTQTPKVFVSFAHVAKRLTGIGFENPFQIGDKLRYNFGRKIEAGTVTEIVNAFEIKTDRSDYPHQVGYYELA
jgi:hypothetical protein